VANDLNLTGDEQLVLRIATLPKATKLVLQPMTADFVDIADHRAVLERILVNQYTSLSAGELLQVHDSGTDYSIIVQSIEPASAFAVSIVNTDCSVEFAEALNAGQADGRQATRYLSPAVPSADAGGGAAAASGTTPGLIPSLNGQLPSIGACDAFRIPLPELACSSLPSAQQITEHYGSGMRVAGSDLAYIWGVHFTLDVQEGDADLYVSALPVAKPGPADALAWSSTPGSSELTVSPIDNFTAPPTEGPVADVLAALAVPQGGSMDVIPPPAPLRRAHSSRGAALTLKTLKWDPRTTITACVRAYAAPVRYSLQASIVPVPAGAASTSAAPLPVESAGSTVVADGMASCSVCGKAVPEMSLARHEAFCARNNWTCPVLGCRAVFKKGSPEAEAHWHCPHCGKQLLKEHQAKHEAQEHSELPCSCGFQGHLKALRSHKLQECPDRYIQCRFCNTAVRAEGRPTDASDLLEGFTGHEAYCGSRTTRCGVCSKSVMLKHLGMHASTYHPDADFDDVAATPPPSSLPGINARGGGAASAPPATATGGGVEWTAEDAQRLKEAERVVQTHCCNAVCTLQSATEEADPPAAACRLCSRCFRLLSKAQVEQEQDNPLERDEAKIVQALMPGLLKQYHAQLTSGCGKSTCCNPACVTGSGNAEGMQPGPAAVASMQLCKLFAGADSQREIFVCVTTSRVLPGVAARLRTGVSSIDDRLQKADSGAESAQLGGVVSGVQPSAAAALGLSSSPAGRAGKAARKRGNKGSVASAFFG